MMTEFNLQGQITNLKFRLDQIYKEFIDMGPSLKNGLNRISGLEQKSERLDAAEGLHYKFASLENHLNLVENYLKGRQDNILSDFKLLKEEFSSLKCFVMVLSEHVHDIKLGINDLKKSVSDHAKSTECVHANALEQSKKNFEASIQDIREKLGEYGLEGINADIVALGDFYQEMMTRLQKYDVNFQTIDKRLSNLTLNFSKQNRDRKE